MHEVAAREVLCDHRCRLGCGSFGGGPVRRARCVGRGRRCARPMGRGQGGGGVIVNTGSVAGMVGFGGVPYGVSKAGGILLTKSLAMEVAKEGIRINAIAPATLLTNFGRDEQDAFKPRSQEEVELWGSFVPTGRASTPEDCAQAALFLASDMSSNTTGAIIPVDGGYLAR